MKLDKWPAGLLELLRVKHHGIAPTEFSETLAPTIDATDHYGVDFQFSAQTNLSAGAFPRTITHEVLGAPTKYFALGGNITIGAAAGTYLEGSIGIVAQSSAIAWLHVHAVPVHVAGGVYTMACFLPRGLLLLPGMQIVTTWRSNAIGADHIASYHRLLQSLPPIGGG